MLRMGVEMRSCKEIEPQLRGEPSAASIEQRTSRIKPAAVRAPPSRSCHTPQLTLQPELWPVEGYWCSQWR